MVEMTGKYGVGSYDKGYMAMVEMTGKYGVGCSDGRM